MSRINKIVITILILLLTFVSVKLFIVSNDYKNFKIDSLPIFQQFTDKDLKTASQKGLTRIISKQISGSLVTVTLKETFFHDNTLNIGYITKCDRHHACSVDLFYNGKSIFNGSGGGEIPKSKNLFYYEESIYSKIKIPDNSILDLRFTDKDTSETFDFYVPTNNN